MGYYRPWAIWRRVQYGAIYTLMIMFLMVGGYYGFIYAAPTCFDGRQSGDQTGVDCGGSCVRICAHEVSPPSIEWTQSFPVVDNQYNAVAYVRNRNPDAGTPEQRYTFRFFDAENNIITERSGVTALPPNSTFAIFEGRIDMLNRELARTEITLEPADLWLPVRHGMDQFRTGNLNLQGADDQPRLDATLENTLLESVDQVEVVATIFDSAGNPLTASQTFVERLGARESAQITFTWPNPIARTVRTCDVPTDIMMVLDRSGSMAADGGDPPEPLESTKRAAERFVEQVRQQDQVGFLSYATEPSDPIDQILTRNFSAVQQAISETAIGTDGTQFTNMGAAFRVAAQELRGPRGRADARKVIVFLTDGDVTRPVNPETGLRDIPYARQYALDNAQAAKDLDIIVYTIGFGDFFLEIDGVLDRDVDLIEELSSGSEYTFTAPSLADLDEVYTQIAEDICEDGPARVDLLPVTGYNFVPLR